MTLPKAIFFDWDGTLVDSYPLVEAANNFVLQSLGMEPRTPGWFMEFFGLGEEDISNLLYSGQKTEAQKLFRQFLQEAHSDLIEPHEGAGTLLTQLFNKKVVLGVVTNKQREFVDPEINEFGWQSHFEVVVASLEAEEDKPSPKPLVLAAEKTGFSPHEILFVGDTETDLRCAEAFGCASILIHAAHEKLGWLERYNPLHRVKNHDELAGLLLG